jgi:hypothetical protein
MITWDIPWWLFIPRARTCYGTDLDYGSFRMCISVYNLKTEQWTSDASFYIQQPSFPSALQKDFSQSLLPPLTQASSQWCFKKNIPPILVESAPTIQAYVLAFTRMPNHASLKLTHWRAVRVSNQRQIFLTELMGNPLQGKANFKSDFTMAFHLKSSFNFLFLYSDKN